MNSRYIIVGLSEFASKIFSWLTLALIPFFASPEAYGEIVLYYSLITFLIPVYLFGQDRLILKGDPNKEVKSSLIYSICVWLAISLPLYYYGYILASIAALLLTLNKLYLTYFRSNEDFKSYALNKSLYSILRFLIVIGTVYYFYSLENYILAESLAAMILSIGLLLLFLKPQSNFKVGFRFRFKHGLPLALHGSSVFGIALADRFILEHYTSLEEVGNYSFIYIFASGLVFLYAIVSVIQEKKIYTSSNNTELMNNIKITINLMFLFGIVGSILSYIIYTFLFKFNLISHYNVYSKELIILLIAYMIFPIYLVANYFLVQQQKNKLLIYCSFISFIINIVLNLLFIPPYGLQGAVYSTLISNILLCIFMFLVSLRVYKKHQ